MRWRSLRSDDLPLLVHLADRIHPDHPESPEALASHLRLFPAGCFFVEGGLGYCLSHPGTLGAPPPLGSVLAALPERPDCLYLHDLALVPEARGWRLGQAIVARLDKVARAHGLGHVALTAVGTSVGFWRKQGFERHSCPALDSYGPEATYMVKALGS